ncbi:MAG: 3-hydroxyacyl-CoA dehydrogenase family protein [Chloroflexi bacterium]|nr:3-hydroxyacyl-CoA dehydrogenase family protein [Chloroflexota bacterium]
MQVADIKTIAVVGAGLMGHGIAQEFALAGYQVYLNDVSDERLQQALEGMRKNLAMLSEMGLVDPEQAQAVPPRVHTSPSLAEVVGEADVVIEAVAENLPLKQQLFADMDHLCPPHTVLASNTSSYLPSSLAAVTQRPDRVLVAHYFNPPYLLPLVELVRHPGTSDETVQVMYDLLTKVGKKPAIVAKEAPGFIGNRLQAALIREALYIVAQGIATPQEVDTVVRNGFGRRLSAAGVFEIADIAGWDIYLALLTYLLPDMATNTTPPAMLQKKVARGELGIKTGQGFYIWTPETTAAAREKIAQALVKIAGWEQKQNP